MLRVVSALVVAALVLLGAVVGFGERYGPEHYETGKAIVGTLDAWSAALSEGEAAGLVHVFARDFDGADFGLPFAESIERADVPVRDGIRIVPFDVSDRRVDTERALEDWAAYLGGFASIDDAGVHLLRLDRWRGESYLATVRFELVGTPRGTGPDARPVIDRAVYDLELTPGADGSGPQVVAAWLDHGTRTQGESPHFVEVGADAGIDFTNRFYPAFLPENRETDLAFGMLRYGPAGITAVDYDDDGWIDLFVPDGEESKLFRNLGDGTFADVTEAAGLGGQDGVSVAVFADWDDDGDADAFVSRTFTPNRLFRNDDGVFVDVTEDSGLAEDCCTTVASWGDVDLDGDLDLYVGRYLDPRTQIPTSFYARNGEPNRLYLNEGDGTFRDVTAASGAGDTGLCLGSAFVDYDDDGDLDLWVANDFGRKALLRNDGVDTSGVPRFVDVTTASGTLAYGAGMSSTVGDYDNDGRLDLYVAHIRSEHGWFASAPTVALFMSRMLLEGTWRTDGPLYWQVFQQSGPDFVSTFRQMASGNTLLRNLGDGTFEDTTWTAGANPQGWYWGTNFADFDNDGWLDLYAANGWVYSDRGTELELDFLWQVTAEPEVYKSGALFDPESFGSRSWHGWERNRHLRSTGPGEDGVVRFEEIGVAAGSGLLRNSRGTAVADFWNRGVLDLAVAASTDRHALLRNEVGTAKHWLAVELEGAGRDLPDGSNRDAVGARVWVEADWIEGPARRQVREVVLGDGYGSQSTLRQSFGLGDRQAGSARSVAEAPTVRLTVRWPRSGREQVFQQVAVDRIVRIVEGREGILDGPPARPAASISED